MAIEAVRDCPGLTSGLIVDGTRDDGPFADFATATLAFPDTPIGDQSLGTPMPYSSGTAGRPKGILRPLDHVPPGEPLPLFSFLTGCGSTGRDSPIRLPPRSTTRRRRHRPAWPSAAAEP